MTIVTIIGAFSVIITYFSVKMQKKWGLEAAFLLIALFSAIRYEYGNDYTSYREIFEFYANLTFNDVILYTDKEFGWSILCWFLGKLPFQVLVALLSFSGSYVFYWFIKNNVKKDKWWLSVFIYYFTPIFFLVQLSMLRQTLAITIVLLAIPYVLKKRIITSILFVLFATIFHTSAIVFLPFVLIGYLPENRFKMFWVIIAGLSVFTYLSRDVMAVLLNFVFQTNNNIESYSNYTVDNGSEVAKLGFGSLVNTIYIIISLILIAKQEYKIAIMALLLSASLLSLPFVEIGVNIRRIGYYFDVFMIVVYPMTIQSINNKLLSNFLQFFLIVFTLFQFRGFFFNEIWTDAYLVFNSIF